MRDDTIDRGGLMTAALLPEEVGYQGAIRLVWNAPPPSSDVEDKVVADIRTRLWGLERASDLILHTVALGQAHGRRTVLVSGRQGSNAFHCQWGELEKRE